MRQITLIMTILLGFFLRTSQLAKIPPGLWYDEAYYAMDALWLTKGGSWQLFFVGNGGREPLFIYLEALTIQLLGAKIFSLRLLSAFIGTLTIALMFAFSQRMVKKSSILQRYQPYLVLLATFSLATSYWHVTLSRTGFRAVLLPFATVIVFYVFWRAKDNNTLTWWGLTGLLLGLSQYTYLSARLLPLVFVIFIVIYSYTQPSVKSLWYGLIVIALVSMIAFLPLGYTFYQNPQLFSGRANVVMAIPHNINEFINHAIESFIRMFINGGDPGWRENFPERPMLGWFGWLGFWFGLVICLHHWKSSPQALFLLVGLGTLYSPALISIPPAHALRQASILPFYYLIFSLGLVFLIKKIITQAQTKAESPFNASLVISMSLISIITLETGATYYDYFYRWANHQEVYDGYNTGQVELVKYFIQQTDNMPVVIPLHFYIHPTTRYLLADFNELSEFKTPVTSPIKLITLPHYLDLLGLGVSYPELSSLVWLNRSLNEKEVHVSRPPYPTESIFTVIMNQAPEIYHDSLGREIAYIYTITDTKALLPMFRETSPKQNITADWGNMVELMGYDLIPQPINTTVTINLYWRILDEQIFSQDLLVEFIDTDGNSLVKWQGKPFINDMYRWRPKGLLTSQLTQKLPSNNSIDIYSIQLSFFNPATKQNLKLINQHDKLQLTSFEIK